jgi:hypothetical protein
MHLWADGLEPEADFVRAWRAEDARVDAGWAPFWHYRRMGRYGEQLADLFTRVDRDRVLVLRYRQLVDQPVDTLNRVARFLGIGEDLVGTVPPDNSRGFVEPERGGPQQRPRLTPEQRSTLLDGCAEDIDLLESVLGESFTDWRSAAGRGSFRERQRS